MAPRPARAAAFGLFLSLGLALLAGGCGERPVAGAPVTLVFKHAKILGPADPVPGLLRRFEAEHPGVRVQSEALTWSSDEQHQFYVINLEGGSPPFDVMMLDVMGFRAQAYAVMRFKRLFDGRCLANVAHLLPHQPRIGSMPQYKQ